MNMAVKQQSAKKSNNNKIFQQEDLSRLAKDIVANAGVGIYIVQHGEFVYVSELYQKITGYSDTDLIGAHSLGNIYPDDIEEVRKHAITCLKEDSCTPYEYRFITKNKEIIWVLETVSSIEYKGERAALGSFIDITERKRVEGNLRDEEQRFRALAEQSSDIIVFVNREGAVTYENPAVEKYLGFKAEERIGVNVFDRIHPDDFRLACDAFHAPPRDKNAPAPHFEIRLLHKDGTWRAFEAVGSKIVNNNIVETVIINLRDITERKRAEESLRQSEEKYRTILENIQEGYFEVDLDGNVTFFNDPVCEIFGYLREELMGLNYKAFTSEGTAKQVFTAFNRVYKTGEATKEFDWQIIRKDGANKYIEASVSLQKDTSGKPMGFKGIIRDITERKEMHQQLNHMATHDALTGLPNRMLFMDRLQVALAQSKRNKNKLAVMMLDLDHFKDVNDNLGHMVGDKLLKEIGDRLTGILRHNDTVARLGGDEFVILLSDLEKMEYAAGVAKVISKSLQKPFLLADQEIISNASIGIALYPDDGDDVESLLKKSDMAMYSVKTRGRNSYQFFTNIIN
jgi:diguanylate cyclase (GGDEF)-like protein/PAS domain S-box-containing protein